MLIPNASKTWIKNVALPIGVLCALILGFGVTYRAQDVPRYKVDPFWPKELPNNWILGRVADVVVDKDDHIWILHSPVGSSAMKRAWRRIHRCPNAAGQRLRSLSLR